MSKLISVIIPVYNIEKYIRRCLDSVLKQTYENFEVVIVDNGSEDSSGAICDEYAKLDSRISVLHQVNGGVSNARNNALKMAKGDYIAFIDGDDFVSKNYLKILVKLIEKNDADIASVRARFYYEKTGKYSKGNLSKECETISGKAAIERLLRLGMRQSVWGNIFKKEVIENVRFLENVSYAEDLEYIVNAFLQANNIVLNDSTLYNYCVREGSAMSQPFNERYLSEIDMLDGMMDNIIRKYPDFEALCRARKLHSYFGIIRLIEMDSNRKDYLDIEQRMIKHIKSNDQNLIFNSSINFGVKVKLVSLYIGGSRLYGLIQRIGEKLVGENI